MAYLPVTALLVGVFLLTMATGHLQHRYYIRAVNRLAARHRQSGIALVSGIGRGRLRGAIVILAVRRRDGAIEEAMVMEGASIFARFRESADLTGLTLGSPDCVVTSRAVNRALSSAARQYARLQDPEAEEERYGSAVPTWPTPSGFIGPLSWLLSRARGIGAKEARARTL